jgi:hypothetical protein
MICFAMSLVKSGGNGYHAWEVQKSDMTKSSIMQILIFSIALGPVLWLLKLTLFCTILKAFAPVRWLKNCVYIGIITTGLFYAAYTIVFALSCGPQYGADKEAYLAGLTRKQCYSATGANAIASITMGVVNFVSDIYLLLLPLPVIRTLQISKKQKIGIYFIIFSGGYMCICSLLGLIFRIQSWRTKDITGSQIKLYVVFIIELAIGLMIPCKASLFTVYRHWTAPKLVHTPISRPHMKGFSVLSSPVTESPATWDKKHLSVAEIPYSRPSSEFTRHPAEDLRMKALPPTPLPVHQKPEQPELLSPKALLSPASVRTMTLPIMFHQLR